MKWLVKSFWRGIRCEITVPCLMRDQAGRPCRGLFEVDKLIESKRPEQPCPLCNEWQDIEQLLRNAPAARPSPLEELLANSEETLRTLQAIRGQLGTQEARFLGRFDRLDAADRELVSRVEGGYEDLMRTLVDEARDGPRLFSLEPVKPGFRDRPGWVSELFRVTLWCEHSRRPLPALNGEEDPRGVYRLELPREWLVKSAPFLKLLTEAYGEVIEMRGAVLRQLQAWLREQDPSVGGLVRVQNKRQEFLWVHPQFEGEY